LASDDASLKIHTKSKTSIKQQPEAQATGFFILWGTAKSARLRLPLLLCYKPAAVPAFLNVNAYSTNGYIIQYHT